MSDLPPDLRPAGRARIELLDARDAEAADAVLCAAFAAYPVMRHVLGDADDAALRLLVRLFTAGRWLRAHPVLGSRAADGRLVGVATLTPSGEHPPPPALETLADSTWRTLGNDARRRYAQIQSAWRQGDVPGQRWHLNMLGVLGTQRGLGHGDALLQAARALADADPEAEGIDLTTEDAANLAYYQRRGFAMLAHTRVDHALQTWTLVAPRSVGPVAAARTP